MSMLACASSHGPHRSLMAEACSRSRLARLQAKERCVWCFEFAGVLRFAEMYFLLQLPIKVSKDASKGRPLNDESGFGYKPALWNSCEENH